MAKTPLALLAALNDVISISSSLSRRRVQERETSQPPDSQDHSIKRKELPQSGAKANEEEEPEVVVQTRDSIRLHLRTTTSNRESPFLASLKSSWGAIQLQASVSPFYLSSPPSKATHYGSMVARHTRLRVVTEVVVELCDR